MADSNISVSAGADRMNPQQQLASILERVKAQADGEVRLRVQVTIYDPTDKQYEQVKEAFWLLKLPGASTELATVAQVIEAVGKTMQAIGEVGPETVMARLEGEVEVPLPPAVEGD